MKNFLNCFAKRLATAKSLSFSITGQARKKNRTGKIASLISYAFLTVAVSLAATDSAHFIAHATKITNQPNVRLTNQPSISALLTANGAFSPHLLSLTPNYSSNSFGFSNSNSFFGFFSFQASVATDKADYKPGETVIISGAGFSPGETVQLQVTHVESLPAPGEGHAPWNVVAGSDGSLNSSWYVEPDDSAGATLLLTATGLSSGQTAQTTFTDNPAANLDQCRNGGTNNQGVTTSTNCIDSAWVNGNAGGSNSHFVEGYSIPYRARMTELPTDGTAVTIELGYDVKHSGAFALDYLTQYPRLNPHDFQFGHPAETVNPINDVSGVSNTVSTFPIPAPDSTGSPLVGQPAASFNSLPAVEKNMTLFGGTITRVAYCAPPTAPASCPAPTAGFYTNAQSEQRIFITFVPNSATAVLAWGGHIAQATVWGSGNSAAGISGSPYHMRLIDWTLSNLGNQDRSLSADAVIPTGTVTVVKNTIGGNGTFGFSSTGYGLNPSFNIVTSSGTGSVVFTNVLEGTKTISENTLGLPSGWQFVSINCTGDSNATYNGASATIDVDGGENIVCTFTNQLVPPKLKLVKTVTNDNGGTAVANDWDLTATGSSGSFTELTPAAANATFRDVTPGVIYTLSESGPSGYTMNSFSCTGGGTQTGNTIQLTNGESVTCTVNNDDIAPKLHLRKVVVNDNGGTATVADFTLTADGAGSNDISGTSPVDSGATLKADTFALSETGAANYTASSWVCVGGTQNGSSITLAIAQESTCTITNNDNAPQLHLRKVVVNDNGGTATVADFTLTANGTGANDISGTSPVDSGATLKADTFALSETGAANYTASSWVCVGGTQNGSSITVGIGESATCTITNNDNAPQLHLRKVVVNDNGGTKTAADFTLTADGAGSNDISGTSPVDSGATLQADTFALSETNVAGYTASAWVCVGGTQNGSNITVGIGQSATCTITNDDNAPQLHLRKVVVNDNGGSAVITDFTLTADGAGSNDISGTSPVDSGATLQADTFALSETNVAGYTASSWVCVGGTQKGSSITLGIGESATCTITNDDQPAYIIVNKVVINNNGGTAGANDFGLKLDGNAVTSGTKTAVKPGAHTASEAGLTGYQFVGFSDDCNVSGQVSVALGETKTCTLTNNDIAPKLHLRKVVVNDDGGTKTAADFKLTANGTGANDISGTSPVDSGATLQADTFALSETTAYGYTSSAWVCVGGTQNGSDITVGIGQSATCTITNNDQPSTIVIKKVTKPTGALTSFNFDADGGTDPAYADFSLTDGQTNSQPLDAGNYTVKELVPLGWVLTGIGGSTDPNTPYNCTVTGSGGSTGSGDLNTQTVSVSLKNGDTVTCVFENTGTGVTRTQGFWATHPQLANIAWFGGTAFGHTFPGAGAVGGIGDRTLCSRDIDTLGKVSGGFWSDISKTSGGVKRSALDQARMQLLQQMLAAELNASAFGSVPSSGSFAQWETAYCGTNTNAIKTAQQQAAAFNTAGDSGLFTPGTSADSKTARTIADYIFWDLLP